MPFDNSPAFTIPAIETDGLLRALTDGRAKIKDPAHWLQDDGYIYGDDCPKGMCAYNAISLATGGDCEVYQRAAVYLEAALPRGRACVASYNDHPDTTHADILALYDRAIAARRGELS